MTSSQPSRKISRLVFCAAAALYLAACSGGDDVTPEGTGGSSSAGSGTTAGTSNAAGTTSGTGNSAGTGNSTAGTSSGSMDVVGTFQVQVLADLDMPTTGMTKVVGQVSDAPTPTTVIWTSFKEEGGCRVEKPSIPFCDPACGLDACVADNICKPYPTAHSVGAVTLKGVKLTDGSSEFELKEIVKAYQPAAGTMLAFPPFAESDTISISATGGDYAPFELSTHGVKPLVFTSTDFELDRDKPLALTWEAADDPTGSQMYIKLDISHHGGAKGLIECNVDDTGSLTISAAMINELMDLGIAGFPSIVGLRSSSDTAQIAPGLVKLDVTARTEHYVTVKGIQSCTDTAECPDGQTCQSDLTCK